MVASRPRHVQEASVSSLIISIVRYCFIGVGVFLGYYMFLQWRDARVALEVILITCVAFNGIISFISHVIFHKSDAERLGLESANPGFQFEVGFANLAFGLAALLAVLGAWGVIANTILLVGYSLYVLQSVILHLSRYIRGEKRSPGYLWGSIVFGAVYVGNMLFFVIAAILQEHLAPFR
jgi:hypothetical protein